MDLPALARVLEGEPAYRIRQAYHAVFAELRPSWDQVSVLPIALRARLAEVCPLTIDATPVVSQRGDSIKALITLADGNKIEGVLMRHGDRNTVCVSTLVGCPMGCTFCATGTMGMVRKLSAGEIVMQVLYFSRMLAAERERVGSVVFMGMGEPFLNYDAVLESIRVLHDPAMCNIGARHISISTCGIPDGIERLAREPLQVNLAISLHAPNDAVRAVLMPVARAYPLAQLMEAIDLYTRLTRRKVMFEYLLARGVNDEDCHAQELAQLLRGRLCMVNLISYNPTGAYTASSEERINSFRRLLVREGIEATIRFRYGRDIVGACGQLATARAREPAKENNEGERSTL